MPSPVLSTSVTRAAWPAHLLYGFFAAKYPYKGAYVNSKSQVGDLFHVVAPVEMAKTIEMLFFSGVSHVLCRPPIPALR
jgi:hypothetical protein